MLARLIVHFLGAVGLIALTLREHSVSAADRLPFQILEAAVALEWLVAFLVLGEPQAEVDTPDNDDP